VETSDAGGVETGTCKTLGTATAGGGGALAWRVAASVGGAVGGTVGATVASVPIDSSARVGPGVSVRDESGRARVSLPTAAGESASSRRITSSIVCGRSAGCFASIADTSCSIDSASSERFERRVGGATTWCIAINAPGSPSNGRSPHSISNSITPSA
jgi:hypothetical protein